MAEATGKDEDYAAYYAARPTEELCDKIIAVEVVGKRCVYLNDYRIAGGKPYYTENLPNHNFQTDIRSALDAFSEAELSAALRERRARQKYFAAWRNARKAMAEKEPTA